MHTLEWHSCGTSSAFNLSNPESRYHQISIPPHPSDYSPPSLTSKICMKNFFQTESQANFSQLQARFLKNPMNHFLHDNPLPWFYSKWKTNFGAIFAEMTHQQLKDIKWFLHEHYHLLMGNISPQKVQSLKLIFGRPHRISPLWLTSNLCPRFSFTKKAKSTSLNCKRNTTNHCEKMSHLTTYSKAIKVGARL